MSEQRASVRGAFPELAKYGTKLDRAIDTALRGGVKECRFLPSGRKILTVVGSFGDEFVDPLRQYCSCSDFFFSHAKGGRDPCYHLLSLRVASGVERVDVIEFSDEEYVPYLVAVVGDVFEVLGKESG